MNIAQRFLLLAMALFCFPSIGVSREEANESETPRICMHFQEFNQVEGITSPTPTVVGDGPIQVYTHAKPALVVAPEHVKSIQLMYYDGLTTLRLKFTPEATDQMVASLKGLKGKRLMTGIIDGKPNGNQMFSSEEFTMEFFFHSIDQAVAIVKAYDDAAVNKPAGRKARTEKSQPND